MQAAEILTERSYEYFCIFSPLTPRSHLAWLPQHEELPSDGSRLNYSLHYSRTGRLKSLKDPAHREVPSKGIRGIKPLRPRPALCATAQGKENEVLSQEDSDKPNGIAAQFSSKRQGTAAARVWRCCMKSCGFLGNKTHAPFRELSNPITQQPGT